MILLLEIGEKNGVYVDVVGMREFDSVNRSVVFALFYVEVMW